MARKRISVDEAYRRFEADPEIAKHLAEREQRHAARVERGRQAAQPVLADLRRCGFEVDSLDDIARLYAPLPPRLIDVLLEWIPRIEDRGTNDALIGALAATRAPFEGRVLVECFEADQIEDRWRWSIANTFACANVRGINDWLVKAVQTRESGHARQMLVLALAKHVPAEVSLPILRSLLDELPGHVAEAMRKIGGAEELEALKIRLPVVAKTWVRKEFEKSIRAIEKRLAKPKKPSNRRKKG